MFEFHGWFGLAENTEDADAGGLDERVAELQRRLDALSWPTSAAEVRMLNGRYFLHLNGLVNRARWEAQDVDELLEYVATRLPGSYGLLWRRDAGRVTPPGPNAFEVVVLARGQIEYRTDPYLSPIRPTIED